MFLQKIYKEWRLLFWAVLFFIAAQCFFMYKGISTIPFFLYYMYGQKHPKKQSIDVILLKTPTGYFNTNKLSGREQEMLLNPIDLYISLKTKGDGNTFNINHRFSSTSINNYFKKMLCNDSLSIEQFPTWWATYYKAVAKPLHDSVTVVKSSVSTTYPYLKLDKDSVIFKVKIN